MTLDKLGIGHPAVITRVGGEGALRLRLLDMGIIPKTRVIITKTAPLGDPIELSIRGYTLTLRGEDARMIEVEPLPGGIQGVTQGVTWGDTSVKEPSLKPGRKAKK